ncbi:hypothetical protein DMC30DRAFT_233663 [Rhodotorula diobovata]|uniref:Proteophosphoglycan ppg4 n=1 Tax=Rhodotorula diobovata TaxID=5288 RepID=A0A5C5FVN7_9BASI|nr:hypothetical protein DMC30DRAFT_233663 [Rhodotorula diobovata]
MAQAGPYAAFDDAAWDSYAQAPPFDPPFDPQLHAPNLAQPRDAALSYAPTPAPDATVVPRDTWTYDTNAYVDAAYTYAPQRSYSSGTTPSPALPGLSRASSASASSASASSSFSGLVSPYQHATGSAANDSLLPPVSVQDGGLSAPQPSSSSSSSHKGPRGGFAELQELYFQQQQQQQEYPQEALYQAPQSPAYTHVHPSCLAAPPPPSTPRRQAAASHLYRSPSAYPATSSPATSPYHRPTPRSTASFPSGATAARRGSTSCINESPSRKATPRKVAAVTQSVNANGSPTKSIRRVAKLSIDVPPPPARSRRTSMAASAPPSSRPAFALQPAFAPASEARSEPAVTASQQQLSDASVREVEQLLGELGPILNPSLFEDDSAATRAVQDSDASMFSPTTVNISGVTLAEEDFRLLDDAVLGLREAYEPPAYPQSAPAWQTSFSLPPAPPQSGRWQPSTHYSTSTSASSAAAQSHALSHSSSIGSLAPASNPHVRAHSAHDPFPPSAHDYGYPTSPSVAALRRRSSCHALLGVPRQQQPLPWSSSGPSSSRQPHYPSHEHQPLPLPTVLQPAPDSMAQRPVTPPPRDNGLLSPSASPTKGSSPLSHKTTPKRKRGSPAKPKAPVAMFVNYSAQDAVRSLSRLSGDVVTHSALTLAPPSGSAEEAPQRRRPLWLDQEASRARRRCSAPRGRDCLVVVPVNGGPARGSRPSSLCDWLALVMTPPRPP